MIKWTSEDVRAMTLLSDPFKYNEIRSPRSLSREKTCYDPKVLMQRVTPQIIEVFNKGLEYETPDGWDRSFTILGGGQERRRSEAILRIMNWNQFMDKVSEIRLIHNL